ncbi:MAG: hypothetical protein ACE5HK_04825 [Candidatus Methylomirabilales bacterium]
MEQQGRRVCDLCGEGIPPEEPYRRVTIPADAAAVLLASEDLILTPTMTQEPDGSVRLKLCLDCALDTDLVEGADRPN